VGPFFGVPTLARVIVASLTSLLTQYGLFLLFGAVAIESAGVPVPGETTLIAAAVLAKLGHFELWQVILVAAAAAIIGDNIGYWLGREGGRRLLGRWKFVERHAERTLPPAERFFNRHGAKTIFLGRFIAVLRVAAAWLAGVSHMPWWRFFVWNAAGGIVWAISISLLAYAFGQAVADAISRYGLYAVLALIPLGIAFYFVHRWMRRRFESA
jgi:membrane protein DedA with SNARE-associated domain